MPRFCERARAVAGTRPLVFYGVPGSVPFYFERSQPNVWSPAEAVAALRKGARGVVTNRVGKEELREIGADLAVACASAFWTHGGTHGDGLERTEVWQLVLLLDPSEVGEGDDGVSSVARVWW